VVKPKNHSFYVFYKSFAVLEKIPEPIIAYGLFILPEGHRYLNRRFVGAVKCGNNRDSGDRRSSYGDRDFVQVQKISPTLSGKAKATRG